MKRRTVERHKRGWAVVEQQIGGFFDGMKTILTIWKTKAEAHEHIGEPRKEQPDD